MSTNYPDFHTHEHLSAGEKGQKGTTGDKGRSGQDGRVTEIVYAFEQRPPEDLDGPNIPPNWEKAGNPINLIEVHPYQSVVYMPNSSIWTYLPGCNAKSWKQTGYVNAELFNIPGDKGDAGLDGVGGDKGDKGAKGDLGEKGQRGLPGRVAQPGEKGEKGSKGDTGEKGVHGVHGVRGVKGDEGVKGDKGEPGLLGLKGDRGAAGLDGTKGERGLAGLDGVVPGIATVPVMMASFNGKTEYLGAKYNCGVVVREKEGVYRFRLTEKTRGGPFAMTMVTIVVDDSEDDIPNLIAAVGRQTDRVVTVAVRNLDTNELTDAHVNIVMYNPSPTA
jgi:hypothetical protein